MARYQVVGECAHVTVGTPSGPMVTLLLKGALLPDAVTAERLEHLLSVNLIAPLDGVEPIMPVSGPILNEQDGGTVDGGLPEVDGEEAAKEQERAAARSKLPPDGSAPRGNASHDVWVEFAVLKGYDRAEVEKTDRDDIKALFAK